MVLGIIISTELMWICHTVLLLLLFSGRAASAGMQEELFGTILIPVQQLLNYIVNKHLPPQKNKHFFDIYNIKNFIRIMFYKICWYC